jgi:hypothetical protein
MDETPLSKPRSSRKDLQAVQDAFNAWSQATGRNLTALSRVLAMSTGPVYGPEGQMGRR